MAGRALSYKMAAEGQKEDLSFQLDMKQANTMVQGHGRLF